MQLCSDASQKTVCLHAQHHAERIADHTLLQVAVEKSRGNTAGAIDTLRKYLDTYQNDKEAWEELAELYLEVGGRAGGEKGLDTAALALC